MIKKRKPLKQYRARLYKTPTKAEEQFRFLLRKHGIKYYFQKQFTDGKMRAIVDFYVPKKRIVIELLGGVHLSREAINKDKYRTYWLRTVKKCKVIEVWNEDIGSFNFDILR